jgi:sugar lactone lactonase YvrE
LYFVDSPTRRIDVFDYSVAAGTLARRRTLASVAGVPGNPDGLTVDADGRVWVAFFGGGQVRCFAPSGRLEAIIEVPGAKHVTSCAFGGVALDRLFITTARFHVAPEDLPSQPAAGRLHVIAPGVVGKPCVPFPADFRDRRRSGA